MKDRSLRNARHGFQTRLLREERADCPAPVPPDGILRLIYYPGPLGDMSAYLSPPADGSCKQPAVLWLPGEFRSSLTDLPWAPAPPHNDQSARAFREAGIVTMYPSLRGGNDNPGVVEGFFGEVDDVLAAADYLAHLNYVDPERIYLGGHSTGGTLALLAAECSDRFRAVFSFGPIEDVCCYEADRLPFDVTIAMECELRAPVRWLHAIQCRTFIFEGTRRSNYSSLQALAHADHPECVDFIPVEDADHFSLLAPITALIAQKILADTGPEAGLVFSQEECAAAMSGTEADVRDQP